jgi:nitroreductase
MKKLLLTGLTVVMYSLSAHNGVVSGRKFNYCDPEFPRRTSAYAMSGEKVPHKDLMAVLEAASFAPSSYNNQPWRFIIAERDTPEWNTLFNLLVPFNQTWCKKAGVLIMVISKLTFDEGKPSCTHAFDAGAACENMALQGMHKKLVVHGIEGFDYERARKELRIPQEYAIQAMFAIGKPGKQKDLKELPEKLRKRDSHASQRKPLSELVFKGTFGTKYKI